MNDLKSRMFYEDVYMSVFEDLYFGFYLKGSTRYYNILNVVNLDKILPVLYKNYLITYENVDDFSANFIEIVNSRFYFCFYDQNGPYDSTNELLLNKYETKPSFAFDSLIEIKPEFRNLLTDIIKEFDNYLLNLDFMFSILQPSSVIYGFSENFSYSEVIIKLKEYMIEEGIALPINSLLGNDLFKPNESIDRKTKPVELFQDRLKSYRNGDENIIDYWCAAVHYALIEKKDIDEFYHPKKLIDPYIDNDESKVVLSDNEHLEELRAFFDDDDND